MKKKDTTSSEKKRKTYTRLSESQKQEVIRSYHLERKRPSELAEEYGVMADTIRFDLRKFAAENDIQQITVIGCRFSVRK